MGARYEIEELEYASGYEKMYGVTDEQLAFLSRHQDNLRRFEVEPTYDAALDADLERLARKRDELSRHGFETASPSPRRPWCLSATSPFPASRCTTIWR